MPRRTAQERALEATRKAAAEEEKSRRARQKAEERLRLLQDQVRLQRAKAGEDGNLKDAATKITRLRRAQTTLALYQISDLGTVSREIRRTEQLLREAFPIAPEAPTEAAQ